MAESEAILIVDDEERIRELLVETLKAKGFTTLAARHGEEGWKIFQASKPAAVITDLMLPRMDGFQLVEKIRATPHGKEIPIIMMSAVYRDLKVQNRVTELYHVEYLVKPFSLVDLVQKLKKLLAGEAEGAVAAPVPQVTGKLEHFSVPLLLISFFSGEKTGLLKLQSAKRAVKVYFDKGIPVFAEGRVRKADEKNVREVLRSVLGWSTGDYTFDSQPLAADLPRFHLGTFSLIYEGARRYYRLDLLAPQFQGVQNNRVERLSGFDEKVTEAGFRPEELAIVEQIDGQKTVGDLVTLGSRQIENVFQILWILHFMKVIAFQV